MDSPYSFLWSFAFHFREFRVESRGELIADTHALGTDGTHGTYWS